MGFKVGFGYSGKAVEMKTVAAAAAVCKVERRVKIDAAANSGEAAGESF